MSQGDVLKILIFLNVNREVSKLAQNNVFNDFQETQ